MNDDLRNPTTYVKHDGDTIEVDHQAMLADITGTRAEEWSDSEGPDSRCGVDYYYYHGVLGLDARINDDQGLLSITVLDEDEDEVAEASIDISEA
jgi:hypothetical protein